MPAKEIKELRQTGKLDEALVMAKAELADAMSPIYINDSLTGQLIDIKADLLWPKRNLSWVYYEYLKQNQSIENFDNFISYLIEIKNLQLPVEEKMLFEQLSWQIGKMVFALLKTQPVDINKGMQLFEVVKHFHFPKPTEGYSFLFKGFHKILKDSDKYIEFVDWWGLENFMPEDFQKESLPDGKEVMAIAEQAYITYTKHLLPKEILIDNTNVHLLDEAKQKSAMVFFEKGLKIKTILFDKEKALNFLPFLSKIVDDYPQFQYPGYFNAKLLLALGDKDNMLESLLPFAKKKRNDFWVWDILSEAFSSDLDKVLACYCKALSCKSPEEMLVNLRQRMAGLLISKNLFNEAKTEIDLLVAARNTNGFKTPNDVTSWQSKEWYKNAVTKKSNIDFYKQYLPAAEALLFSDTPEETVIVEFVNSDKKMLNFIASETKFGFFKYDRFFRDVKVGDTLKVRFQGGSNGGMHQIYTAIKVNDDYFKKQFMKEEEGNIRIPLGKSFGFLNDIFVHPSIIKKLNLSDGSHLNGLAIKSYNQEKKLWGWKLI